MDVWVRESCSSMLKWVLSSPCPRAGHSELLLRALPNFIQPQEPLLGTCLRRQRLLSVHGTFKKKGVHGVKGLT